MINRPCFVFPRICLTQAKFLPSKEKQNLPGILSGVKDTSSRERGKEARDGETAGLMQPHSDWLSKPLEITGRTRTPPSCPGGMGKWEVHHDASELACPKKPCTSHSRVQPGAFLPLQHLLFPMTSGVQENNFVDKTTHLAERVLCY